MEHSFVIPAYKESPYLEDCIRSVTEQTVPGGVLIATSTPNDHIRDLAARYAIKLCEHEPLGIAGDWNSAVKLAGTKYVTIAHQDDVYENNYREVVLKMMSKAREPLIAFTDYAELRGDKLVTDNRNLKFKKMLLFPLRVKGAGRSRFIRRRVLSLGNPVCCPSVTVNTEKTGTELFEGDMRSNIDWQAWEVLSRREGSFVYIHKVLMAHRIHAESTTSEIIGENKRREEDIYMLRKFWPGWVANLIEHFYSKSEDSNSL